MKYDLKCMDDAMIQEFNKLCEGHEDLMNAAMRDMLGVYEKARSRQTTIGMLVGIGIVGVMGGICACAEIRRERKQKKLEKNKVVRFSDHV